MKSVWAGLALLVALAAADCSRDKLVKITDAYVAAQMAGSYDNWSAAVADDIKYTENFEPADIETGILSKAIKMDHTLSIHDAVQCRTFTEIISTDSAHPYVIGTRMQVADDGTVSLMESIVTDAGDWAFNATGYLYWTSLEKSWAPIPEADRDSREVIQAAGDAYFNRFADAKVEVPFGTPCARLEGGAYTGRSNMEGNTCNLGLPSTITVTDRRYVVDEVMGAVDIFVGFPGLDRSQGQAPAPDSHFFRVEKGEIRYIHTVSSCVEAGCGM